MIQLLFRTDVKMQLNRITMTYRMHISNNLIDTNTQEYANKQNHGKNNFLHVKKKEKKDIFHLTTYFKLTITDVININAVVHWYDA